MDIEQEIKEQINSNPILLYMKGSPDAPQCGFSSRATQLLIACGKPFSFVDILSNPEIRANLPKVSKWPTLPQLFIKGELIGGSDILTELHESGELQKLIDSVEQKSLISTFLYFNQSNLRKVMAMPYALLMKTHISFSWLALTF